MEVTTVSSQGFSPRSSRSTKASSKGPGFLIDQGKPAHVLLSTLEYQRLAGQGRNILDALSMPGLAYIEFDPPKLEISVGPANFS